MGRTYQATYSAERWNGVPNLWVQCEDIRLESNQGFPMVSDLCRALKAAGRPDGPITFSTFGRTEQSMSFSSIYEIADGHPSPTTSPRVKISDELYAGLCRVIKAPRDNWFGLHGRMRSILLDRGFVAINHELPTVTPAGHAAIAAYQSEKDEAAAHARKARRVRSA